MKKIVYIRTNSIRSEPRLIKEYTVGSSCFNCHIISWNREKIKEKRQKLYNLNLAAPYGSKIYFLFFPIWSFFCFFNLIKINPDLIHACDSEGVFSSLIYSKLFRKKIIFDMWDATLCRAPQTKFFRNFCSAIDRFLIKHTDMLLVPDKERLNQIDLRQCKYEVIPNSEKINSRPITQIKFTKKKTIHISYVGTLSKDRGVDQIIKAAKELPDFHFTIAGYGPDEQYFQELLNNCHLKNLDFLGRVNYEQAKKINQRSDIMISLLNPEFNNYKYATSTKIFEAFSFFKPVITTKNTASGNLVKKTSWGLTIDYNSTALINSLNDIKNGKKAITLDTNQCQQFNWENAATKILAIYKELI